MCALLGAIWRPGRLKLQIDVATAGPPMIISQSGGVQFDILSVADVLASVAAAGLRLPMRLAQQDWDNLQLVITVAAAAAAAS